MEGIETQKMSGEFNQMEESQVEEQKLGLGFQKPNSPDGDFTDQTLDRKLSGDRDEELSRKLEKLDVEGSKNGEEVRSLVSDSGIDEERELEEVIDEEKQKLETNEGLIGEEQSSVEKIGGEIAGNGGVGDGDGDGSFTNGAAAETEDTKHSGAEYEAIRGKIYGNSDEVGDGGLKGFANGTAVETEDIRCSGEESEAIDGEENGADFEKVKDGNADKDGSKWSQIENEEGSEAEECRVVEENGADCKEVKGGSADKGVSKWSQIEDEERNDNIDAKEWVEDEEEDKVEAPNNYESNWGITENGGDGNWGITENGGDGDGNGDQRFGSYDEPQTFDNYEDERNGEEHYDGEANWYKNAERSSVGFNDGNYGSFPYPLRPDAEDCSFYMKTGNCKFGSNCKFNHPLRRKNQANEPFKQKEEYSDRSGQTECKYHSTPGGCKYGKACRYNHSRGKPVAPVLEFNFLGLPIRAGERECPYYMRTGSCKYGSNCRFNHPDPTAVGGGDSASQGRLKDNVQGWPSARTLNGTAPFVPVIYPPTPTAPPNAEWNGYKAPAYPTSERNLPTPPAFAMSIPIDANFYGQPRPQLIVEEFPERPGQPECSYYLKTGDCKYRSTCKFHHPKSRSPRLSPFTLGNQGLPLRPDQNICTHYSRYGKCKYGPSCKFSHPAVSNGNLASSVGSDQGEPPHYGNSRNAEEEWNM